MNKLKEANELTDNSDMADDDYIDNDTLDDMFSNICHNVNNPEKHSISGIDVIIKTEEADKDNNADDDEIYIDDEDAAEDVETDSENDTQKE